MKRFLHQFSAIAPGILLSLFCMTLQAADQIVEESFPQEDYGEGEAPLQGIGMIRPGLESTWRVASLGGPGQEFAPRYVPEGLEFRDRAGKQLLSKGGAARVEMEPGIVGSWNAQRALDFTGDSPLAAFSTNWQQANRGKIFVSFLVKAWAGLGPFQNTFVLTESDDIHDGLGLHVGYVNSPKLEVRFAKASRGEATVDIDKSSAQVNPAETNLVVLAIDLDAKGGTPVDFWVNPPLGGNPPIPDGTINSGDSTFNFVGFALRSVSGGIPIHIHGTFDEIRFGPTFESVTPIQ